jgi:hypothetical protein
MVDELEWVPYNLAVKGDSGTCHGNTDKAGQCEYYRDYDKLDILSMRMLVSGAKRVDSNQVFAYARSVLAYL